jgi:hypothetical protein
LDGFKILFLSLEFETISLSAVKGISKLSGQAKSNSYPQPEGLLADCMLIYGKRLGEESSLFGESFIWCSCDV